MIILTQKKKKKKKRRKSSRIDLVFLPLSKTKTENSVNHKKRNVLSFILNKRMPMFLDHVGCLLKCFVLFSFHFYHPSNFTGLPLLLSAPKKKNHFYI